MTGSGGTAILQPVFTVATLTGSAVATVNVTVSGFYTVKPSNPVSQGSTSGAGTGCTLNITYNDPTSSVYRAVFTDQAGSLLWVKFGASHFVGDTLMAKANALDFVTALGATALSTVLGSSFLSTPQGRLSVFNGAFPITAFGSDQTTITRIYWTPYNGNACPIYNGTSFITTTAAQLTCDLTSGAQASGGIYDVFKFLNAGVATLGFGPSWVAGTSGSVTAGSCVRGTGTGSTQLVSLNGIYTNNVAMTVNNGATTFSVAQFQGTYLGSVYVNSTAGQINCYVTYGQSRVWGLYNAYNKLPINLRAGDGTASWTYNTNTVRESNGGTTNILTTFVGLQEEIIQASFLQQVQVGVSSGAAESVQIGIGINATNAQSGTVALFNMNGTTTLTSTTLMAQASIPPGVGINNIVATETVPNTTGGTKTFFGTEANMVLKAGWLG